MHTDVFYILSWRSPTRIAYDHIYWSVSDRKSQHLYHSRTVKNSYQCSDCGTDCGRLCTVALALLKMARSGINGRGSWVTYTNTGKFSTGSVFRLTAAQLIVTHRIHSRGRRTDTYRSWGSVTSQRNEAHGAVGKRVILPFYASVTRASVPVIRVLGVGRTVAPLASYHRAEAQLLLAGYTSKKGKS